MVFFLLTSYPVTEWDT